MDNIFGIGLPEFILILVIAGMVMGPERIVRAARSFGRLAARMQSVSRSFIRQLNAELESVDQDGQIKGAAAELNNIRREIAELQRELLAVTAGTRDDVYATNKALRNELDNAILPPELRQQISSDPLLGNESPTIIPPATADHVAPLRSIISTSNGTASPSKRQDLNAERPRRLEITEDPD